MIPELERVRTRSKTPLSYGQPSEPEPDASESPTLTTSPTSTGERFPYLDDPDGRMTLELHHGHQVERVRCHEATVGHGGVIVVRIFGDDMREVFISPHAYEFAQVVPTSELDEGAPEVGGGGR